MQAQRFSIYLLLLGVAVFTGCDALTDPQPDAQVEPELIASSIPVDDGAIDAVGKHHGQNKLLAEVRAATAKYHRIEEALADGFVSTVDCVAHPTLGAMGIHYVNPARVDDTVNAAEPEVLLYEPTKNGRMRLVAVEYLVNGPTSPPDLGGTPFDPGPPGVSDWALHAWIWLNNPSGMFAPFNPNVSCP